MPNVTLSLQSKATPDLKLLRMNSPSKNTLEEKPTKRSHMFFIHKCKLIVERLPLREKSNH